MLCIRDRKRQWINLNIFIPAASLSKVFERLPLQLSTDVKSPLLVANTMGHHGTDDKPDSLRLKHESIILKPQELAALRNGDMLNDSVCDKYLYIIEDCISSQLSHCRIKFFGTFMYENLRIGSFSRAAEHYKHENMFTDYDLVVFLVHVSPMHWSAGFLLVRQKRIIYLDSLTQNDESTGDEFTEFICSWLEKEAKYKGMPFNRLEYCRLYIHNIPQQRNLVDCGVYACEFIRRTVLGLNVTSQVRVRKGLAIDLRKKMEDSLESGFLDEQSHTNNPVEQLLSSSSIFPQFAVLKQKTIWVWLQWEEDRKFYPAKVAKQSHDTITAVFDNKTKRNIRILSNAIYPLLLKVGDHVLAKKSKTESSEAKILRLDPLKGFDTEIEVEFVRGKKEKKVVMLAELAGCWKHVVKVVKDVKVIDRKGEVEGRVDLTSLP
ncbi:hypothetical protein BKA69DRAFT_1108436 [Paraphysoderma sedebokerense]|nr:hypothetical protein BKA69DRAFT_1108436 [Paraphysoderma sedebokerense]